jgi:hypothetical protein
VLFHLANVIFFYFLVDDVYINVDVIYVL